MFHLRCACGRTSSVADEEAGGRAVCPGCLASLPVPVPPPEAPALPPGRPAAGHDFDAEIVRAARSRAPRPTKTPSGATSPPTEEPAVPAVPSEPPPPRRRRRELRGGAAAVLAWSVFVAGAAGGWLVLTGLPAPVLVRAGAAVALYAAATGAAAALFVLTELRRPAGAAPPSPGSPAGESPVR